MVWAGVQAGGGGHAGLLSRACRCGRQRVALLQGCSLWATIGRCATYKAILPHSTDPVRFEQPWRARLCLVSKFSTGPCPRLNQMAPLPIICHRASLMSTTKWTRWPRLTTSVSQKSSDPGPLRLSLYHTHSPTRTLLVSQIEEQLCNILANACIESTASAHGPDSRPRTTRTLGTKLTNTDPRKRTSAACGAALELLVLSGRHRCTDL